MIRGTDHFGHREATGIVVDLFRFESLGWNRRRPASHSQRHLTTRRETDHQNHRQQSPEDSHP